MQSQCLKIPLRAGKTQCFLDWVTKIRGRQREAFEAMSGEGVIAEAICLERGREGDAVVYYQRARDLERASEVFATSELPIDRETRAMIDECWDVANIRVLDLLLELYPHEASDASTR